MLVRIRGGEAGIKEYLERGRKGGRDFDRAELDERVILAGDLELTDAIIKGMSKEGERYLHVTISFKEDEISRATLEAITEEFRAFAFAAFETDEYNFYAEAHLPKIKSYEDRQSGELIERKPHIHIVIPETNLLTGRGLNPFGRVEHQIKFIEAWQEASNNRHGLASPKDHRRAEFTDESTILARHKGDYFEGSRHELKGRLLAEVLERGITDFAEFGALVAEHGAVRTRNAGKPGAYLNVKPEDVAKGINLKEYVFSREFIELSAAEKLKALAADQRQRSEYETRQAPRPTAADIEGRLTEWREVRAAEVKYLNSGNRKEYAEYRAADSEQKRAILAAKAVKFYAKREQVQAAAPVVGAKPPVSAIGREPPPTARGRLRTLADLPTLQMEPAPVVEVRPRPELRPQQVRDALDGRDADNVVGQLAAEHRAEVARSIAPDRAELDRIKRELDAARLIEVLEQTHGVMPGKYEVATGQDGADRVKVGKRNLNVSDFLTAELHLPWQEAERILRETYAEQRRQDRPAPAATEAPGQKQAEAPTPTESRPLPRRDLWAAYQAQRADQAARTWTEQRQRERARRAEARRVYQAERRALQDRTRPAVERKAARSVLAVAKVAADRKLWEQTRAERAELRAAMRPAEAFRAFLAAKADQGDAEALAELRRQRRREPDQAGERIEGRELRPEAPPIAAPRHRVDQAGNVTYYDARDRAMFIDQGARVRFTLQDREALETGLRLAVVKFGSNLSLRGSDEYKAAMIEIAADTGLRVTFDDPESQARYIDRREAMRLGREYIDQAGAPSKQQEPPASAPEALGAMKVQEAATEAPTKPAALDRARDRARAEFRDESADRSERIRAAGMLCGLQAPLGAQEPAKVAAEAAKVVGPLGALDKDEFMRGVRSGVQQRQDLERQARDLAPTTKTPEPKGKSEDGPAPTKPTRPRKSGHSR
jgi:hypothetical protein